LYDALVSSGDAFDNTTLAYSQYKLHVCAVKDAFIGAVLSSHVNMSALKMAVALARRDLSAMLIDPRLQDAINSVGRPPEPPAHERPAGRSYRGHRIPD
jgi:hypothetical protein